MKRSQSKEDDNSFIEDMDPWTTLMVKALVPPLLTSEPVTDDFLAQPIGAGKKATKTLKTGDTEFKNLEFDNSCGEFPLGQWAKLKFTQSMFTIEDKFVSISEEDVPRLLESTLLDQVCPKPNVPFVNPTTDEGLTRQAFYGLGSHRVVQIPADDSSVPNQAVFQVDLMAMNKYPVRAGFAKYGACAYFDEQQQPLAIRTSNATLVYPTDGYKWEVAKFAWRSSLITMVTAVDHLYNLHFFTAAQMLRALTEAFPKDHPIKRALQPFIFRTALINNKAGTALLPEYSILHHITAFTWEGLCELARDTYQKGPEWMGLPAAVAAKGGKIQTLIQNGKLPYYQDGLDLYHVYESFVDKVVPEDITNDAAIPTFWNLLKEYTASADLHELTRPHLVQALATYCFHVTAQHEQVGSVAEHLETPLHGGFRMMHNALQVDKQSFIGGKILLSMTSIRTPPLKSAFAKFWKSEKEVARWGALQSDLEALEQTVSERNQTREHVFQAANPAFLQCAVSV